MHHIGIDLGGRESQLCVRDEGGKIVAERRVATQTLPQMLSELTPAHRVVMETCAESFAVASAARRAGHDVRVVAATLVRSLGVGARGIKTDVRDARVLGEVSCRIELPSVHVPSASTVELKTLLGMRDALVECRSKLCNTVRSYLRGQLQRVRCTPETMPKRVREFLLTRPEGVPACIERQLRAIEELNEQVKEADKELESRVENDEVCRLLMTAPCVGPVTAARFRSSIDDVSRFTHAHALESYLGLTPGEDSSSERQRRTGITKAGPSAVRKCLAQACWTIYRTQAHDPLCQWGRRIAERKRPQIAVSAMSRKLAGALYAMWRDQRPYDPERMKPRTFAFV